MCSICGMFGSGAARDAIDEMNVRMARRGPDQTGTYRSGEVTLGHNRLAVIDPAGGAQPMTAEYRGRRCTVVYNGELYNTPELKTRLAAEGATFRTHADTEVVLWAYLLWGEDCPTEFNGIFAFAVYDEQAKRLFLARDRLGVKPLYYAWAGGTFLFASEVKSLLAYPGVRPTVDRNGLWELLFLAPVTLPESGVFRDVKKLLPGQCGWLDEGDTTLRTRTYWKLVPHAFAGDRDTAVATVRELMTDAVRRQMVSDVPLCTLLSGGLDSSVVTAVAADDCRRRGETLSTYSFEYVGNRENFKKSLFQPESDDLYASWLARELGTDHTVLTASSEQVYDALRPAVEARDLPGQADIDSSLLYFCSQIKHRHTVALSGECADEIFGGYPWFYRPEMLGRDFFPWLHRPLARVSLFDPAVVRPEEGLAAISERYRAFLGGVERLPEDDDEMYRSRVATQLSVWFFMQSLLERKDRMSMYSALEVRVPFADHRIIDYVYNVPWRYKFENGVEKSLLRHAMVGWLPDRVLFRKKSPYPKTHDPRYEQLTRDGLLAVLDDPNSRLHDVLDRAKLREVLDGGDFTWFGQLMSRPQLYAWLLQLEHFLRAYKVELVL